jgi:glycogen synthase
LTEVVVDNRSATEVIDIVRELRAQGLIQGHDFDFAFRQAVYTADSWTPVTPKQTIFTFHTEKYATLFALKYL